MRSVKKRLLKDFGKREERRMILLFGPRELGKLVSALKALLREKRSVGARRKDFRGYCPKIGFGDFSSLWVCLASRGRFPRRGRRKGEVKRPTIIHVLVVLFFSLSFANPQGENVSLFFGCQHGFYAGNKVVSAVVASSEMIFEGNLTLPLQNFIPPPSLSLSLSLSPLLPSFLA